MKRALEKNKRTRKRASTSPLKRELENYKKTRNRTISNSIKRKSSYLNTKSTINYISIFRTISILVIIFCIYRLYYWSSENKANKEILATIKSQVSISNTETNKNTSEEITSKNKLDFSTLSSQNSDTVAWIKINNTNIDFPVVRSNDNDYYTTHNFNNEYNTAGWIFADYRNKFDGNDKNIIIYGHNRRDGSMFSTLNNVFDESWYTNPDNQIINLYTPEKTLQYKVFSIYKINASNFDNTTEFTNSSKYKDYLDKANNSSIYNFNQDLNPSDKILTVYTCANNNYYRLILQAKLISE